MSAVRDPRVMRPAILWAALLLALAWFVLPAALDREPPRQGVEGVAHTPRVRRGEAVHFHWRLTYVRECQGASVRWLTSEADRGLLANLPTLDVTPWSRDAGPLPAKATVAGTAFWVPHAMPLGPAHYHARVTFACNWLQRLVPALRIAVAYPVIGFEVLPAAGDAAPAPPPAASSAPPSPPPARRRFAWLPGRVPPAPGAAP